MRHAEGLIGQHVAAMRHRPIDRKALRLRRNTVTSQILLNLPVQTKKNKALMPVDGQLAKFIHFKAGKHESALL